MSQAYVEGYHKFAVDITEYERGWGSKHWSTHYFVTYEEADQFYQDEYAKNDEPVAPDWYTAPSKPRKINTP